MSALWPKVTKEQVAEETGIPVEELERDEYDALVLELWRGLQ